MTIDTGLRRDALGVIESTVMGVAGTAPAFSVAATTATLIAAVGVLAPASLIVCGLIILGIAISYAQLNRLDPNAGASYAWVGKEFGAVPGFFAGWALLVASAVFMVSGTIPAATATLMLIDPARAADPASVTFVAAGWLLAITAVLIKGIKLTSWTQMLMTGIETGILIVLIIAALIRLPAGVAHVPSARWFLPGSFTPRTFAHGVLVALFFFWGWDVAVNLNEETRDASRVPGTGSLAAMLIVLLLFVGFVAATLLTLDDRQIQAEGTRVIFAVAQKLLPGPWAYLAILAVILSTVGTIETSILQFTRTLYAMGRDGVLHRRYAVLHGSWQTPWVATLVIALIGLTLLFFSAGYPSVNAIMHDSVDAIGFQVAFYYGLAGLTCVWHYRRSMFATLSGFILRIFWPLSSALFLLFTIFYSLPTFNLLTDVVGLGGIVVGAVPLMLNRGKKAQKSG